MEEYIGKTCPFCKTEIKEGDTVKVCPECGIPHHEACWEENKGCTTFGCSQQHYEEQHTNPTDVCANCGAPLGEGQAFCPKCGAAKGGEKARVCSKCGAQLQEGQDFCPKCGQKAGLEVAAGVNAAISQFNAGVEKKKRKGIKIIPIVVAVALIIATVAGVIVYKEKEAAAKLAAEIEDYKTVAGAFYTLTLSSGADMETVGNAIQSAWRKYINSSSYGTYYNGTYIYSVDTAVSAAQSEQSSKISSVKSSDTIIASYYKDLLTLPDPDDQELQEIKEAVKDVYSAYQDMYDCVITPSGNYSSWTSEFGKTDSALSKAIGNLSEILF